MSELLSAPEMLFFPTIGIGIANEVVAAAKYGCPHMALFNVDPDSDPTTHLDADADPDTDPDADTDADPDPHS
ncbi:hypothetical protein [Desulfonatronum parangueonense]